jgi:hypothetical protein
MRAASPHRDAMRIASAIIPCPFGINGRRGNYASHPKERNIMSVKSAMAGKIGEICKANKSGWGAADSVKVLVAGFDSAAPGATAEDRAEFEKWASKVVNPSATRQWLESAAVKLLVPAPAEAKAKRGSGIAAELAELLAPAAPAAPEAK